MSQDGSKLKCKVVTSLCNNLFKEGITTTGVCALAAGSAGGLCLAVGLGPQNPFATTCAVALTVTIATACKAAVDTGGNFTADLCKKSVGCEAEETLVV